MGEVWYAEHRLLGFAAAVKVLAGDPAPALVEALDNEIHALAGLDHPNIARVIDRGRVDEAQAFAAFGALAVGSPWVALQWADGGTLLDRRADLDWSSLKSVLDALLAALAHTHARGVVHRDVKPSNLLFDGPGLVLRLTDFGMARSADRRSVSSDGGTPAYMAPEQFTGDDSVQGPWTDLYQVGVVAWSCATGSLPFPGEAWDVLETAHCTRELPQFVPRFPVPERFGAWLGKLLRKDPSRRFRFAADASRALDGLGGIPSSQASNPTIVANDAPEPRASGGRQADQRPGLALLGLRRVPLVGRRRARDTLWAALRHVHANRSPRLLLIEGAWGQGKSRLAEWLCVRAHELGSADSVWTTHADVPGAQDGLVGLAGRALGVSNMPPAEARERVMARWSDDPVEGAALASLAAPSPRDRFADPADRYRLIARLLTRLTRDRPVVVRLDDVQWGVDALGLVEHLLDHHLELPLLVVATVQAEAAVERPVALGKLESLKARPQTTSLPLGPLPARHWQAFLADGMGLTPELADRLAGRVRGNTSFAIEIVLDWAAHGHLVETPKGLALAPSADQELPRSLQEVWGRRLASSLVGRSSEDLHALELASVLGTEVDVDEWSDACWLADIPVPHRLADALRQRQLMRVFSGGLRFVHAMLREVVVQRAREAGRLRDHHELCGQMLEGRVGRDVALRRARHLAAAEDWAASSGLYLDAARQLGRKGRLREAETALGEWSTSMDAVGAPDDSPMWAEGWVTLSQNLRAQGRMREAARWATEAESLAEASGDDRLRSLALRAVGLVMWDDGDIVGARARLQQAVKLATLTGDAVAIADTATSYGLVTLAQGDRVAGARSLRVVLGMCRTAPDPWVETQALLGLAYAAIQDQAYEDAEPLLARARALARQTRARSDVAYCSEMTGELLRAQGRAAEAEAHYRRAWREYDRLGSQSAPNARLNLAICLLDLGRQEEARLHLWAVLEGEVPASGPVVVAAAHLGLLACAHPDDAWATHWPVAESLLRQSAFAAAEVAELAETVASTATREGRPAYAVAAWGLAAHLWDQCGKPARAAVARAFGDGSVG